jgi:ABC-type multidrug transport system fused ATPase/permease subunit
LRSYAAAILKILQRPEKIKLGRLIALSFIISALDIAFLAMMLLVVNFYTKKDTPEPAFLQDLFPDKNSLLPIAVFLLLFTLKNWLGYRISSSQHHFFHQVASRLSGQKLLEYMQDDYSRFVHIDSSVLIRRISQQPIEFSTYILTNVQQIISQGMLICCTVAAILFYHPALFLLLFLLLLLPVYLVGSLIRKKLRHLRASNKSAGEKTIQHLQESLSGYIESNIYDRNDFFIDRYSAQQQRLNMNIATQHSLQELPARLIEVFAMLGFLILVAVSKWQAGTPFIDLLSIGVFLAGAYKIIPGIVKIMNATGQIKTYQFVLKDLLTGKRHDSHTPALPVEKIHTVRFEQVRFGYTHQLLKASSFELQAGDLAGISGRSGRGKTTLVKLLLGFLEQEQGRILINGRVTDAAGRRAYWKRISYVKQQPFLINDSILKNITLTDGAYDTARLEAALSFCGIDGMLAQYPEGVLRSVTEHGKNISGGQRQRIMLARALYHDFDLLILDEPFSEMDAASESAMLAQLTQLAAKGKIILLITHNKASLAFCNKIILPDSEQYV